MDRRTFLSAAGALPMAGVHVIISGHTHDFAWMPAKEGQPLNQLIGGGPVPKYATIIYGSATPENLTLTMKKLDGTVLKENHMLLYMVKKLLCKA